MIGLLRAGYVGFASGQYDHSDSYSLIRLEPELYTKPPHKRMSMAHRLQTMTPYLGHKIGMNASVRSADEEKALYDWMILSSKPRTSASWVFEGRVHWYLHSVCETFVYKDMGTRADCETDIEHGDKTFSDLESLSVLQEGPGLTESS